MVWLITCCICVLPGFIADKTGDVGMPFLVLGLIQCTGGLLALVIAALRLRRESKKAVKEAEEGIEEIEDSIIENTDPKPGMKKEVSFVDYNQSGAMDTKEDTPAAKLAASESVA